MDPANPMRSVTYVVDGLGYRSHSRQVSLLAPAMKASGRSVRVISLTGEGPLGEDLRAAGISIEGSGSRHLLDFDRLLAIRRIMHEERSSVFHVFGLKALRAIAAIGIGLERASVVLTLSGRERLNPLDRRLLRRCKTIAVSHEAAAAALHRQRLATRVDVVPLAVAETSPPPNREDILRSVGITPGVPVTIVAGRLERRSDLFPSLWQFAYVSYVETDAEMLVVGDGASRVELENSSEGLIPHSRKFKFAGARSDVPKLMYLAKLAVVMKPHGGKNVALEAMAAGLPVVAADTADLRSIIKDGEMGALIPMKESLEASRAIRNLLFDADRRSRMGAAAREWVRDRHSIARVQGGLESLYEL